MAEVDPFVAPIPKAFREDREVRDFMEYFIQWAHDMYERVGGPDDAITDIESGELYEPGIQTDNNAELVEGLEVDTELGLPAVNDESVGELEVDESLAPIVHDMLERVRELEIDAELWVRQEVEEVATTNFLLEVSKGNIPGHSVIKKFGRNGAIATNTTEEVWTVSTMRTRLTVAATMEAISTDTNDTAAGSGAQKIMIEGVDSSWNRAEEEITMNGTSATTATSTSFFRIDRAYVTESGTYGGNNDGDITIRVSSAGSTQAEIEATAGQTEMAMYAVPTGHKAYIRRISINADASRDGAGFNLYQYTGIDDVATSFVGAKRKLWGISGAAQYAHVDREIEVFDEVVGPADIVMEATAPAGGTIEVEATFDIILVQDGF